MTTTYPNFNDQTEALEVASAFPDAIRQKTILITGVNIKGIGYATAEAFVGLFVVYSSDKAYDYLRHHNLQHV